MGYSRALCYASAVAAAFGLAVPASAQLTKTDTIVGDWHVYTSIDNMTDRLSCAAFYKDEAIIQLSPGSLYIEYGGRGGWRFYKYRFGEGKPITGSIRRTSLRTYITFEGRDLEKAIEAGRLRVQTLTLIAGVIDEDIDLKDAQAVSDAMAGMGCQ